MGVYNDIVAAVKQALILNEKVENTGKVLDLVASELRDHDRRIVRLETLVEVAKLKQISDK
ncbi:MAG: hypothetical protein MI802_21740 [Desulfobacterales bacterium]|nr:hypothetical protein [Desulfobacterales bacterium]